MEIFRNYGLAERLRASAIPSSRALGFAWLTRMNGYELGEILFAPNAAELQDVYSVHSPETPCFTPQDEVERIVAAALENLADVELRHETSAITLEQDQAGVTVMLRGKAGEERVVRARYVIGADGTRSNIRAMAGIGEAVGPTLGDLLTIYFESEDFDRLRGDRPYQLWFIVNGDAPGAAWPVSYSNRWLFAPEQDPKLTREDYTPAYCLHLIQQAAGAPVQAEVLNVNFWRLEEAIAERWRDGRVFLIGDAAHRFPPHGGYGMNSGIQDAQNLAWKLALVLRGQAGEHLLDSYEAERRPVAEWNIEQTRRNTKRLAELHWGASTSNDELALIDDPSAGRAVRQRITEAVPLQRESIFSQGQQFGAVYVSGAVVGNGQTAPTSTVSDYRESAAPGARAPHLWLRNAAGARLSTLDLCGFDAFTLLVGAHGQVWRQAAAAVKEIMDVAISVAVIGGPDGEYIELGVPRSISFLDLYELEP